MNQVSLLFIKVSLRKNLALEGILVLNFHKIYNLSPPSAVQRSPSVQQNNTAVLLPNDTVTHNAAEPRTNLFTDIRSAAGDLEFCSVGTGRGERVYLSKRSSASSVGLVLPFSGLAWHAASCSVRRRLISAKISLGNDKRPRHCCGGGHKA